MQEYSYPTEEEMSDYYFRSDAERKFSRIMYDFFDLDEDSELDGDINEFKSEIERRHAIKIPEVPWVQFKGDIIQYIGKNFSPTRFPGLVQKIEEKYDISFRDTKKFETIDDVFEYLYDSNLS